MLPPRGRKDTDSSSTTHGCTYYTHRFFLVAHLILFPAVYLGLPIYLLWNSRSVRAKNRDTAQQARLTYPLKTPHHNSPNKAVVVGERIASFIYYLMFSGLFFGIFSQVPKQRSRVLEHPTYTLSHTHTPSYAPCETVTHTPCHTHTHSVKQPVSQTLSQTLSHRQTTSRPAASRRPTSPPPGRSARSRRPPTSASARGSGPSVRCIYFIVLCI